MEIQSARPNLDEIVRSLRVVEGVLWKVVKTESKSEKAVIGNENRLLDKWATYSEVHNERIKNSYILLMRFGFEQFDITPTTSAEVRALLSKKLSDLREMVEQLPNEVVMVELGQRKSEVIRYLSAVCCGLDQFDLYKTEVFGD